MEISFGNEDSNDGPDLVDNTAQESSRFSCEVCGIPLVYSGRGRHPKYCDEHKTSKTPSRKSGKNVDTLILQIGEMYMASGALLSMFEATASDSMLVSASASTLAESWRPLIERDPAVRKFWEKMTTGGGWGAVIMAHGSLAIGIMTVHGIKLPSMSRKPTEQEEATS